VYEAFPCGTDKRLAAPPDRLAFTGFLRHGRSDWSRLSPLKATYGTLLLFRSNSARLKFLQDRLDDRCELYEYRTLGDLPVGRATDRGHPERKGGTVKRLHFLAPRSRSM
jgi:hypothetical protein